MGMSFVDKQAGLVKNKPVKIVALLWNAVVVELTDEHGHPHRYPLARAPHIRYALPRQPPPPQRAPLGVPLQLYAPYFCNNSEYFERGAPLGGWKHFTSNTSLPELGCKVRQPWRW